MKKRTRGVLVRGGRTLILIILLFAFPVSAWWNGSYVKEPVFINNTGNVTSLVNYPVKLNVTYNSANMDYNFTSVHVINETSGLEVSYWKESQVNGSSAIIYFNATVAGSSWSNSTYALYHRNVVEQTVSDRTLMEKNNGTDSNGYWNNALWHNISTGTASSAVNLPLGRFIAKGNQAHVTISANISANDGTRTVSLGYSVNGGIIKSIGSVASWNYGYVKVTDVYLNDMDYVDLQAKTDSGGGWYNMGNVTVRQVVFPEPISQLGATQSSVSTYIPPRPLYNGTSCGNFFCNITWSKDSSLGTNVTDGFNVTINQSNASYILATSATNYSLNISLKPRDKFNVTIQSWNNTGMRSNTLAINNATIINNPVTISNISASYSIPAGATLSIYTTSLDLDGDTPAFSTNATKGSINSGTGVFTYNSVLGDVGAYAWNITGNDGYGSTSTKNFTVTVNSTVPGQPLDIAATTGNFWVNTTWNVSINTDSFNISMNGTWMNGTTSTFMNSTNITPHAWHNMSVYGYNATSQVTGTAAVLNIQIPNNVPVIGITTISSGAILQFQTETITTNITDLDNDNQTVMIGLVYGGTGTESNYTAALIPNTTTYTYSIAIGGAGTYAVNVYTSDNYTNVSKSTGLSFVVNTIIMGNSKTTPSYSTPPRPSEIVAVNSTNPSLTPNTTSRPVGSESPDRNTMILIAMLFFAFIYFTAPRGT
jgi:hypothetical protein